MGKADPDPIVKTTLRLPRGLLKAAKLAALTNDLTLQDYLVAVLRDAVRKGTKV